MSGKRGSYVRVARSVYNVLAWVRKYRRFPNKTPTAGERKRVSEREQARERESETAAEGNNTERIIRADNQL